VMKSLQEHLLDRLEKKRRKQAGRDLTVDG